MSAISRRPPSNGGSNEAPSAPGYLLDERLPESDAAVIASRLDEALRARISARRRLRFATAVAVTSAAAAVVVGLLVARNPSTVAPERTPPLPPLEQAARPEPTRPASPPVAKPETRSAPLVPEHPSPPVVAPPREPEPEIRRDLRPAPTLAETEKPASAAREAPDHGLVGPVVIPADEERVVRMFVRRTDDPQRAPILMTIRYRRPAAGAIKEVPR
jgi:hypothetical protein